MIGKFLIIWLVVGFLVGVKTIYIDKAYSDEKFNQMIEEGKAKGKHFDSSAIALAKNKGVGLAINTLGGFYSLYSHTKEQFKKKN